MPLPTHPQRYCNLASLVFFLICPVQSLWFVLNRSNNFVQAFFFFVIVITRRSSAYIELVTASFRVRWYHNRKKLVLGMGRYYTMIISQCLQPCVYIYSSHDHMFSRAHRTIKGFICLQGPHCPIFETSEGVLVYATHVGKFAFHTFVFRSCSRRLLEDPFLHEKKRGPKKKTDFNR